jgi:hypothetical protein
MSILPAAIVEIVDRPARSYVWSMSTSEQRELDRVLPS